MDLLRVRPPSGSETEWTVTVDPRGNLGVVMPDRRDALPPAVLADINNQSLLGPVRALDARSLYLMAVSSWSAGPNFPGVNDPFMLEGTLFGPFPSEAPAARAGRLAATRGDVLDGLVRGDWHPFNGAVEPFSKSSPPRWLHMLLPAGDEEQTREGEALVLAYPLSQAELDLGCAGNEECAAGLLFDLLSALKSDAPGTLLEGMMQRSALPIPNRAALEARLKARGFAVKGDVAKRPRRGLLGWLLRERVDLPPQGRVDEYLRLSRAVMEIFPDWPGGRAALLWPRTRVDQVSWTVDRPTGLRPIQVPGHKGEFTIQGGFLVSQRGFGKFQRCLYFEVDESYSRWNRGNAELTIEFRDGVGGFGVDYGTSAGGKSAGWHGMRGTGQLESTTFPLADSDFRRQENGGTDFRLSIGSRSQFRVRRAFLRALPGGRPATTISAAAADTKGGAGTASPPPPAPPAAKAAAPRAEAAPPAGKSPRALAEWGFDSGWTAMHQVTLQLVGETLVLENTGIDPHIQSPPVKIPGPVVVRLFMKSTAGGKGEIFWQSRTMGGYESHPSQFEINHDGDWHEYRVPLYELGTIIRLRLDPGMAPGKVEVGWMIVEPFTFPAYAGTVTESARVVYFDGRYPTIWAQAGGRMAEVLERRGFPTVDADHLRAWMLGRIKGGAPGSVCFMSQDATPDTVLDTDKPDCTIRRYMDAGGRVVWIGYVPLQDRGFSDGTRAYSGARDRGRALGFSGWAGDMADPRELTEDGKAWGMQLADRCDNGLATMRADVTTVLTSIGKHYASSYFKNYNPKHPYSGLVRYRPGNFRGNDDADIEDLLRVGLHGLPGEAPPAEPRRK